MSELTLYKDLMANRRNDGLLHPVRQLIQPNDPMVKELARVLHQAPDFIEASQDFVNSYTSYKKEDGDFWATPAEMLEKREGDCDDAAILLCSILRNYLPEDKVFCAFGTAGGQGHMWVVSQGRNGEDRIVEATAPSTKKLKSNYNLMAIFNDKYAFVYPQALKSFQDLIPIEEEIGG